MYKWPMCPGCGNAMEIEWNTSQPDRPWESTTYWTKFVCKCGWISPTIYGTTPSEAISKAQDAAMKRAGIEDDADA